jgi:nitrite reductase/ring-hydroxylating ferredoxin subunit
MEIGVASTNDLAQGSMIGIEKDGEAILIANVDGKYYAIGNTCTHMGCTLSDGTLDQERVECPCHGSTFNVRTGAVVKGPALKPEPSYTLRVEGEKIFAVL